MAAEGALWTVDPSLGSTLPNLDEETKGAPEPVFDIEHSPPPPAPEPEPVFEEPEPEPSPPPCEGSWRSACSRALYCRRIT